MAEPPYGIICNRLKAGMVIPFLGAGASFVERPPGGKWEAAESLFLPSGLELAHFLAGEAGFPSTDPADRGDLAKVSSYYVDVAGRSLLRHQLREVLNHAYQGSAIHEFLAAVPAPLVIVVTNYDTLVEQAFRAAGKPYDLVVYPSDRKDIAKRSCGGRMVPESRWSKRRTSSISTLPERRSSIRCTAPSALKRTCGITLLSPKKTTSNFCPA
jgi:hypothetical protein